MLKPDKSLLVLFTEIHEGREHAFNELFGRYYERLVMFSLQYVKQEELAEELTSELFVKLWLKRETLAGILNPEVYLYVAIKNASLNLIRGNRKYAHVSVEEDGGEVYKLKGTNGPDIESGELETLLDNAIAALPEQRRIIFRLIKEDGLKSKEVGLILNISVRTVENQLYKAVKVLADQLSVYLGYHPQKRISRKQVMSDLPLLFFF
ncbi:RNA polymerase sigma-70 factor (family 1) [Pedobacter africanus]|uniref:RNA polymerase sigma-70 factor (ECF subfamily) n=1 Tax=Pedobacter africanus TaxID=151894 RepID=A0ACC6L074_9SPHI|nr:RNA polymerase sigma-70 factor [Pedobacter africanus]MDR6784902.1 RNA polymerase sigma-70 factor (ECF subfamily) [Pedobacter africanus]